MKKTRFGLKDGVREKILEYVSHEKIGVGSKLPSEKDFAKIFGVSHLTVRSAMKSLIIDGTIEKRPRSGTYLKNKSNIKDHNELALVAVAMRTEGHLWGDLSENVFSELRDNGYLGIKISCGDPGSFRSQLDKALATGCRRLALECNSTLWFSKEAESLGLSLNCPSPWKKIVWFHSYAALPEYLRGDVLRVDFRSMMRDAVRHLVELGHKRICLLTHEDIPPSYLPEYSAAQVREFASAMGERYLADDMSVFYRRGDGEDNDKRMTALLSRKDRPTAFIGESDIRLVQLGEVAARLGLKYPKDMALVGINNTPWAAQYGLTSISMEPEAVAKGVIELLKSDSPENSHRKTLFSPTRMVIRGSCGGEPNFSAAKDGRLLH